MKKRPALLLATIFAATVSAISVVSVKHQSRKLFVELQGLERARDAMQVEWGQLQLEQSVWATHDRIQRIARDRLDLYVPPASKTVLVIR